MSGGTDNHLMLVDLRAFGVTGKQAQEALDAAAWPLPTNAIPNDPEKPFVTERTLAVRHRRRHHGRDGRAQIGEKCATLTATVLRKTDDDTVRGNVRDAAAACSKYIPSSPAHEPRARA